MILILVAKAFEKIQYSFIIKILRKIRIKGNLLNLIKQSIYEKANKIKQNKKTNPTANIACNGERLNAFSLRLGTSQRCLLSFLIFNIVLDIVASTIR